MVITHSRESTRTMQGLGTTRPHLRAQGPARLQDGLDEEKLKPWTTSKRNHLSLRPRIHTADPQRRTILPLPSLVFSIQAREAGQLVCQASSKEEKMENTPEQNKALG